MIFRQGNHKDDFFRSIADSGNYTPSLVVLVHQESEETMGSNFTGGTMQPPPTPVSQQRTQPLQIKFTIETDWTGCKSIHERVLDFDFFKFFFKSLRQFFLLFLSNYSFKTQNPTTLALPGGYAKRLSNSTTTNHTALQIWKAMATSHDQVEGEEDEYVVLDLDAVSEQVHIPPNAPYVLSGLDTSNPILIIDDKIKLIGEYEETLGSCIVLSETDAPPDFYEQTGPSEANLFSGKLIINPNQVPKKQVKPVCQLQRILRFKLLSETQTDSTIEQSSMKPE
ncbi:hypothetical protein L1987_02887 [Smallanthus sonchifolius]|uniref:Uncharacterized protein n=1 Tax=Smallanthus sonchifolius TaxID=185202 RepID=A0ACB9K937_9ASTR|nr:hypothetical protein L1987_02887 [Smallanthus sonchifolius]